MREVALVFRFGPFFEPLLACCEEREGRDVLRAEIPLS